MFRRRRVSAGITLVVVGILFYGAQLNCRISKISKSTENAATEQRISRVAELSTTEEQLFLQHNVGNMTAYDERLLQHILSQIARPTPNKPRNVIDDRTHFSQFGESVFLDKHMKEKRDGFFIECGALDRIDCSNSLFFERERNWTGLLIEANPTYHKPLLEVNRNAYVLSACLSTTLQHSKLAFKPGWRVGGLVETMNQAHINKFPQLLANANSVMVNCYSLNSIMAALGIRHIDLFSLDVEGAELPILRTIDWDRLHIDLLLVEYSIAGDGPNSLLKLQQLREFFSSTRIYREVTTLNNMDVVFERI